MVMQPNKDKLKKQAEEHINATSENIRDEDIERVINEEENINKKLKDNCIWNGFLRTFSCFWGWCGITTKATTVKCRIRPLRRLWRGCYTLPTPLISFQILSR